LVIQFAAGGGKDSESQVLLGVEESLLKPISYERKMMINAVRNGVGEERELTFGERVVGNLRGLMEAGNRMLEGSNCIFIENGLRRPFAECTGCRVEEAVYCVRDMRFNLSGTVPVDCNLNKLMQAYEPTCCPQLDLRNRLDKRSSAYPIAFSCLRYTNCLDSPVADALRGVCAKSLCVYTCAYMK
jgi:hypothetical protein